MIGALCATPPWAYSHGLLAAGLLFDGRLIVLQYPPAPRASGGRSAMRAISSGQLVPFPAPLYQARRIGDHLLARGIVRGRRILAGCLAEVPRRGLGIAGPPLGARDLLGADGRRRAPFGREFRHLARRAGTGRGGLRIGLLTGRELRHLPGSRPRVRRRRLARARRLLLEVALVLAGRPAE